ncbi:hypothetical protein H310_12156 [Aphanomyces invadans]|uniref:Uncharacterized protein n=1 Tax=Aphanomyces invadans TaxID=157072 RepID=A0A024TKL4_9STRA|nr:hypothetical protein H310_12156 [Aphanomyces invadans]ETV94156.1 hypothetical protein H310_12156 [Aphanomyces invadans]|eukprot:XP_008877360.1 hypothetical protein H310_12156 [Aphanomyces invadans]
MKARYDDELPLDLDDDDALYGWSEPHQEETNVTVDWSRPLTMVEQESQLETYRETQRKLYKQKKAKLAAQAAADDIHLGPPLPREYPREPQSRRPQARIVPVFMELDPPPLDVELHSPVRTEADLHALTQSLDPSRCANPKPRALSPPPLLSDQLPAAVHTSPPVVRVRTVPPSVVLELDKSSLPHVAGPARRGPVLDDADLYAHETHYSNNLTSRVKKGLSFHASPPLRPFERDRVQKALAHKSKTRRHVELQQLEQALRMRETRKVDIERQMRMARSFATLRQPPATIPQTNVSVPTMSTLTLSLEKRSTGTAVARSTSSPLLGQRRSSTRYDR